MNFWIFLLTHLSVAVSAQASTHFDNPTYPGTNLRISYYAWDCGTPGTCIQAASNDPIHPCWNGCGVYTSEQGICRALGYTSAVPGSAKSNEGSDGGSRIQVDPSGRVSGATAGRTLNAIDCVGPQATVTPAKIDFVGLPLHPGTGLPFSRTSESVPYSCVNSQGDGTDEDLVCKSMGYVRSAKHSSLTQRCPTQRPVTILDNQGNVAGTKTAYPVMDILCVND